MLSVVTFDHVGYRLVREDVVVASFASRGCHCRRRRASFAGRSCRRRRRASFPGRGCRACRSVPRSQVGRLSWSGSSVSCCTSEASNATSASGFIRRARRVTRSGRRSREWLDVYTRSRVDPRGSSRGVGVTEQHPTLTCSCRCPAIAVHVDAIRSRRARPRWSSAGCNHARGACAFAIGRRGHRSRGT